MSRILSGRHQLIYEPPALQVIAVSSPQLFLGYWVANKKNLGSRIIFSTD